MIRMLRVSVLAAAVASAPALAPAEEPGATRPEATPGVLSAALARAWAPEPAAAPAAFAIQSRRGGSAGPNIGAVGLGGVAGLSDFEIGPSFRYWVTERWGLQAHLGFGGDDDFLGDDVEYMRFEPTFIVAIGDFGNADLNVRPYAGGGLRLVRTDIGDFSDTDLRPAGVGGVEFGFRAVPRLKVSGELSISTDSEPDDFDFDDAPSLGGVRLAALVHYFFD